MFDIPNLHDGFFDGFWISDEQRVFFYVRSAEGKRSTIVLTGVQAMQLTGVKAGNIIFDVTLTNSASLNHANMQEVYELTDPVKQAPLHLAKAQQKGLSLLTLCPSYGAEAFVLFMSAEVLANHILPQAAV